MSQTTLRHALPNEAGALTALALRSKAHWGYDAAFMADAVPDMTVTPEAIAQGIAWVLEVDGQVAGYCLLKFTMTPGEILLADLFVEPEHIGKGYGRRLWDRAAASARELRFASMILEADPNAAGFYEKLGARQVGQVESGVRVGRFLPLMRYLLR